MGNIDYENWRPIRYILGGDFGGKHFCAWVE